MTEAHDQLYLQLQSLGAIAVRQQFLPTLAPIAALPDWGSIRQQAISYPDKLARLLFDGEATAHIRHLFLRLNPGLPAAIADLIGEATHDDARRIDWLQDLPWESLLKAFYDQQAPETPFADWLRGDNSPAIARVGWGAETKVRPHESDDPTQYLLVAGSQPPNMEPLAIDRQVERIRQGIRRSSQHLDITNVLTDVTIKAVCDAIANAPHPLFAVHLIAHGRVNEGMGQIRFKVSDLEFDWVNLSGIANAIDRHHEKHGSVPALVVLNVCSSAASGHGSSAAQQIIDVGVPFVLAYQYGVFITELETVCEALYAHIAAGPLRAMQHVRAALAESSAFHDNRRELPDSLSQAPRLLHLDDHLPGWAVPVLYVHPERARKRIAAAPRPQHIWWPKDGKVMVLVQHDQHLFYIDECPVTDAQYRLVVGDRQRPARLTSTQRAEAIAADDGMPAHNLRRVENMIDYAERTGKRLPTLAQWRLIVSLDPRYHDGVFSDANPHAFGNIRGQGLTEVRAFRPAHALGIHDLFGNLTEIVDDDGRLVRVSSSYGGYDPIAVSAAPTRVHASGEIAQLVGFRTVVTLEDIAQLRREGGDYIALA